MTNELQKLMNAYCPLADWAKTNGHDPKHVRRLARNGDLPSAFKFGNQWYMPRDADDVVPDPATRGTTRDDGRKRYTVYANVDELAAIVNVVGSENVINPRDVARAKRAERKLANAELADAFNGSKSVITDLTV